MPEQIGSFYPTQVPSYTEAADIRKAFNLYHYGTEEVPTDEADIVPQSIAGYIRDTLQAIEDAEIGQTVVLSLQSTDNLNFSNAVQSGIYKSAINLTNEEAAALNYPINSLGLLNFVKTTDSTYFQTYIAISDAGYYWRVGVRPQVDVIWGAWQKASDTTHTHDNRYFTESEVNARVNMTVTGQPGAPTANSVAIFDANNRVTSSSVVSITELGYLDGVIDNVQLQINGKANSVHNHDDRYYTKSQTPRVWVQLTSPSSTNPGQQAVGDIWFW